jgi:hypothetical protein
MQFASGNSAFRAAYVPMLSRPMWTRSGMSRAANRARKAWSLKPATGFSTFEPKPSMTLFAMSSRPWATSSRPPNPYTVSVRPAWLGPDTDALSAGCALATLAATTTLSAAIESTSPLRFHRLDMREPPDLRGARTPERWSMWERNHTVST